MSMDVDWDAAEYDRAAQLVLTSSRTRLVQHSRTRRFTEHAAPRARFDVSLR